MDQVVVATGPGPENEEIRDEALTYDVDCPYIDIDEDDVLTRYVSVATAYNADIVVRVTGDCPLIDSEIVDDVIMSLKRNDLSSNVEYRTYPQGLDVEVMPTDTLLRLNRYLPEDNPLREHVCVYAYGSDEFRIASVEDDEDNSDLKWCVDTEEDLEVVSEILGWGILPYKEMLARWRRTI